MFSCVVIQQPQSPNPDPSFAHLPKTRPALPRLLSHCGIRQTYGTVVLAKSIAFFKGGITSIKHNDTVKPKPGNLKTGVMSWELKDWCHVFYLTEPQSLKICALNWLAHHATEQRQDDTLGSLALPWALREEQTA